MSDKPLFNPTRPQQKAIDFIVKKKKCALFLTMGFGKTAVTLMGINHFIRAGIVKRVLIIAPLKVARTVWIQEADKWHDFSELTLQSCHGDPKERLNKLHDVDYKIDIINVELLHWLSLQKLDQWDMLIIDESTKFKNPSTQRFTSLKKMLHGFRYVVILTGTPTPNNLLELWSQIYCIDGGHRLGRTITEYRRGYFTKNYDGFSWAPIPTAQRQIEDRIKDICFTVESNQSLPQLVVRTIEIPLTDELTKEYKQLEKKLVITLEEKIIKVSSVAAALNKLLQYCNGAVYDKFKSVYPVHNLKLNRIRSIIESNPSKNFLIAYQFQSDVSRLMSVLPYAELLSKSASEIARWNKGEIRCLLAHPSSGGHGLNLQEGGNILIWFGLTWSLENYQQFNARLHRQGQLKSVYIVHLIVADSVEQRMLNVLKKKGINQDSLLYELKKYYA